MAFAHSAFRRSVIGGNSYKGIELLQENLKTSQSQSIINIDWDFSNANINDIYVSKLADFRTDDNIIIKNFAIIKSEYHNSFGIYINNDIDSVWLDFSLTFNFTENLTEG